MCWFESSSEHLFSRQSIFLQIVKTKENFMQPKELHIVSMVDIDGNYWDVGCTDNFQISALFLQRNGEQKYQKLAKERGVTSFFRVRAIYKMNEVQLLARMSPQIEIPKHVVEKHQKGLSHA